MIDADEDDEHDLEGEDAAKLLAVENEPEAANPRARKRKQNAQEQEERDAKRFWTGVLADPIGRREVWKFLVNCGTFRDPFAITPAGFPHPEGTWLQAGQKNVGERLFTQLSVYDRAGVFLMQDEHDPRFPKVTKKANG